MKLKRSAIFCWLALLCFWVTNVKAAEKLVADYGGHAGFQSATWVAKDLKIFDKHGLDVEVIMITGRRTVRRRAFGKQHAFLDWVGDRTTGGRGQGIGCEGHRRFLQQVSLCFCS